MTAPVTFAPERDQIQHKGVRLQVSPLTGAEALLWREVLQEVPAAKGVSLESFTGGIATYAITADSLARLHAGLHGLAAEQGALLSTPAYGELGLMLHPTPTTARVRRMLHAERGQQSGPPVAPAYHPTSLRERLQLHGPARRPAWLFRLARFARS